jgi:hypothetical protein
MRERIAACACGRLKLRVLGEPKRVSMCHCADCQRRTGSLFSVAAFYPREAVEILEGDSKAFTRPSASGKSVTFHFCPGCGASIYWLPERMPDLIGIAVGAFADPSFPQPEQSVWSKDRHHWLSLPDDMKLFDMLPPPRGGAA